MDDSATWFSGTISQAAAYRSQSFSVTGLECALLRSAARPATTGPIIVIDGGAVIS